MEAKDQVLEAMRKAGVPLAAGKVAELTGLDRKVVDKAFAELKKEGAITSRVRRLNDTGFCFAVKVKVSVSR